jgi:hypothetical protein
LLSNVANKASTKDLTLVFLVAARYQTSYTLAVVDASEALCFLA